MIISFSFRHFFIYLFAIPYARVRVEEESIVLAEELKLPGTSGALHVLRPRDS